MLNIHQGLYRMCLIIPLEIGCSGIIKAWFISQEHELSLIQKYTITSTHTYSVYHNITLCKIVHITCERLGRIFRTAAN